MVEKLSDIQKWYSQEHPHEAALAAEVAKNLAGLLRTVNVPFPSIGGKKLEISLADIPETNKISFFLNDVAFLFIGSFAKSIMDSLPVHLETLISSKYR